MLHEVHALLRAGGWVSLPLLTASFMMWFVATLRFVNLRRGFRGDVVARVRASLSDDSVVPARGPVDRYLRAARAALRRPRTCQHHLERFVGIERERARDHAMLLMGFVAIAPLLGLLGTVSGMIETFASMQGLALTHATEQTVAGGISVALVSTQLGLVIGVPGLAAARLLARSEQRRARELAQAHSVLISLRKVPP